MISQQILADIKMLVSDVDGVLTDGSIIYGSGNIEYKAFNIKDGLGMKLAGWNRLPIVWLTGRSSDAVSHRAAELDVEVFQGSADKDAGIRMLAKEKGLSLNEIAYVGDDLNDLPVMRLAGLPIAVADAAPEVRALASYVTKARGGRGAIREIIELILRGQNRWEEAVEVFVARVGGGKATQ